MSASTAVYAEHLTKYFLDSPCIPQLLNGCLNLCSDAGYNGEQTSIEVASLVSRVAAPALNAWRHVVAGHAGRVDDVDIHQPACAQHT